MPENISTQNFEKFTKDLVEVNTQLHNLTLQRKRYTEEFDRTFAKLSLQRNEAVAGLQAIKSQIEALMDDHAIINPDTLDILEKSVKELRLGVRPANCLNAENIRTIGELTKHTEKSLREVPNLGDNSMREIKEALALYGLTVGM